MKSRHHPDAVRGLPPELAELDAELSGILVEERPSFGPELRNELARRWSTPVSPQRPVWVRYALAASIAAMALAGLAVPPARASLVEGVQRILDTLRGEEGSALPPPTVPVRELAGTPPRSEPVAPAQESDVGEPSSEPAPPLVDLPPFQPGTSSLPSLLDETADVVLVRRHYPEELQRRGIGGSVSLLLWVDEEGAVDHVQVTRGTGYDELDRAALRAAPALRFKPAMRNGVPVGMWVEFDLVFEPPPIFRMLREPAALETPMIPTVDGWEPPSDWAEAAVVPAPILMEAREMLRAAMGGDEAGLEARFGPLDGILSGDAPTGVSPLRWREEVTRALERARVRDPENPAPYLALARLRRAQGLRNDAQMLAEEGLRRAARGDRPVSPRLVAELAYESGRLARENWLGWRNLGELSALSLSAGVCPGVTGSPGEMVAVETLTAWNFSCSAALNTVLGQSFAPRDEGEPLRAAMLRSFIAAVEAYPAHVGANTEILLDLAEREAWHPLLESARRFAWASQSHPNALLLEGLALQRLGRSEEAGERFLEAFEALPAATVRAFTTPELIGGDAGGTDPAEEWARIDPILSTPVNERQVEHWARAAYSLLRFGSLEADAARVWVRYGRPDVMRAFGAGPGLRLEMWDYGPGPDITFYRPAASQNGALTPEADEYLRELEGVLPHRYGDRARPIYELPAQLAQFRGASGGSVDMRLHFHIPAEFTGGEGVGPLEVGVFLLGDGGTKVGTRLWTVERERREVDLRIPAGSEASTVVVELYDPETGVVAGFRTPLDRPGGAMSELLLTDPGEPGRGQLGEAGDGLHPRPSGSRLAGDQVGVFFELYDVSSPMDYRLRAELVSDASGRVVPLEFRPVGESRFSEEWLRRARRSGPVREYLTLDLRGVGPGSYTLRVAVEGPGGTGWMRQVRGVERTVGEAAPEPLRVPGGME